MNRIYWHRHAYSVRGWVGVLGLLVAIYLVIYLVVPHLFSDFARIYVVPPIFWGVLLGVVLLLNRHSRVGEQGLPGSVIWLGLLLGAFQVACLVIAGLLTAFGESPYGHSLYQVFLNSLIWAPPLIGLEFSRAYLLRPFSQHNTALMVAAVTLLYTVLMIPLGTLQHPLTLPFFGGTALPLMAENMLACVLVLIGGPWAAIAYRGTLEAFEWLSPFLPDLAWIIRAFVGTLAPVVGYLVVQSLYGEAEPKPLRATPKPRKSSSVAGWAAVAIVGVALMWVSLGLVGFRPVTIVSGSMQPTIAAGDLVIVREVPPEQIVVGDIIQFTRGDNTVVHRVVEVRQQSSPVFITKGDASASPDSQPVYADQLVGRVQWCVPKLGWVPIHVKSFFSRVVSIFG